MDEVIFMKIPQFKASGRMLKLVDEISMLRERIISAPVKLAYTPSLQKEAFIKNAMGSTAIEGFVMSLPEVKALASMKQTATNLNMTERAVLNYLAALRYIQKQSGKKEITVEDILKVHKIACEGALEHGSAGVFRKIQNYVVAGAGQVIYRPPAPAKVPGLMEGLVDRINTLLPGHLPVISSGILHYEVVAIHPFVDGNGRMARLLGMWELLRRNFDTLHIFAIDDIIYEHKKNYYYALSTANKGDLTGWLEFYLEVIAESLDRAWKRVFALPGKDAEPASGCRKAERERTGCCAENYSAGSSFSFKANA
jgi:Fic family protein